MFDNKEGPRSLSRVSVLPMFEYSALFLFKFVSYLFGSIKYNFSLLKKFKYKVLTRGVSIKLF